MCISGNRLSSSAVRTGAFATRFGTMLASCILFFVALLAGHSGLCAVGDPSSQTRSWGATWGPSGGQGKHCLDEQKRKLMLEHVISGAHNPLGFENQFILTYCIPLTEKPSILFDPTKIELGLANYISPSSFHIGPTIRLVPLSFVTLRAEVTAFYIWPVPMQGAGYIETTNYQNFKEATANPPPGPAMDMYGIRAALGVTLQGSLPLGSKVEISLINGLTGEYWRAANDGRTRKFWYVARLDGIMHGRGDWALVNNVALLVSIKPHPNHAIRIGFTDSLLYIKGSDAYGFTLPTTNPDGSCPLSVCRTGLFGKYVANITAGVLAWSVIKLNNRAKHLDLFLRVGAFTRHAVRSGVTLAAGLGITYELSSTPTRDAIEASEPPPPDAAIPATTTMTPTLPSATTNPAPAPTSEPPKPAPTAEEPATPVVEGQKSNLSRAPTVD